MRKQLKNWTVLVCQLLLLSDMCHPSLPKFFVRTQKEYFRLFFLYYALIYKVKSPSIVNVHYYSFFGTFFWELNNFSNAKTINNTLLLGKNKKLTKTSSIFFSFLRLSVFFGHPFCFPHIFLPPSTIHVYPSPVFGRPSSLRPLVNIYFCCMLIFGHWW